MEMAFDYNPIFGLQYSFKLDTLSVDTSSIHKNIEDVFELYYKGGIIIQNHFVNQSYSIITHNGVNCSESIQISKSEYPKSFDSVKYENIHLLDEAGHWQGFDMQDEIIRLLNI